jgi:hypothetical protein
MSAPWKDRAVELPGPDQAVLVATRQGRVVPAYWQVWATGGFFADYDAEGVLLDEDVIWWMPFPDPP